MTSVIEGWLSTVWPLEAQAIRSLSFIESGPGVRTWVTPDGYSCAMATFFVRVSMPAAGPVCAVCPIEQVGIALPLDRPAMGPEVYVRDDFPPVPHLSSRIEGRRRVCLTRKEKGDYWSSKTLCDVTRDIYVWLCDAAAGMLVKDDDPFEPLIAGGGPPVELNIDFAKKQCSKNGGIWETTSNELLELEDGSRVVVNTKTGIPSPSDILTHIWYGEKEQAELWIDPPTTEEELIAMMGRVGFNTTRVANWISRRQNCLHRLIIVGIKRPRQVLGKLRDEEWIAFQLNRKKAREKCAWKITTHPIVESFSREIARETSGFAPIERNVLMIGAGALGSEMAEAMSRSGIPELTLIDPDILRPHNLARHTLASTDIGKYKAKALAEKISGFYPHTSCRPICEDILRLSSKEATEVVSKVDCVLDSSASIAVQSRLADLIGERKPSFSAFQIAAGKGTILIYTPDITIIEPNMIEAILVSQFADWPIISAWLGESADVINIGGGCASLTSMIPNSLVKFGAGWLADRVLRLLNSAKWPQVAFAELLEYDLNKGTIQVHRVDVERPNLWVAGTWRVFIPQSVGAKVREYASHAIPNETGGVLIGRIDRQRRVVYVTDVWKAPKDSESTRTGFSRGLAGLANKIAMLEKDTNEYFHYVGEWHSHPPSSGVGLSSTDSTTAKRMAEELEPDRIPATCLITNTKECSCHVVEGQR